MGDRGPDKRNLNERESVRGREWSEVRQLGSGEEWVGCVSVCVCVCAQIDTECTQLSFQYSACVCMRVQSCELSYVCGCRVKSSSTTPPNGE